jgi:hypothetical protein
MVERRRRGTDTHDWHHLRCIQLLHPLHFVCSSLNASYSKQRRSTLAAGDGSSFFPSMRGWRDVTHRYFNPPQQADLAAWQTANHQVIRHSHYFVDPFSAEPTAV